MPSTTTAVAVEAPARHTTVVSQLPATGSNIRLQLAAALLVLLAGIGMLTVARRRRTVNG